MEIVATNFAYKLIKERPNEILIEDRSGVWKGRKTITNAAELVIEDLFWRNLIKKSTRVLYIDSDGNISELSHDGRKFTGFITNV